MKKKFLGRLLTMLLVAAMVFTLLPASAIAAAEWWGGDEYADDAATQATDDYKYNIFFLDCGRKYYSVDSIKQFIDNASAAGFNYIQLAVGNDGLRFLLDDMSLTVNGTTYDSAKVSAAIHRGNEAYYNFDVDELTQSEMDTIIAYASSKGMGVIPCVNTPSHMDAILSAATSLTNIDCSYNGSVRTIDVSNSTAVAFTKALLQKYIAYFAAKSCKLFNMGADEYANDIYSSGSMGFGNLQKEGHYGDYVTYVNQVAKLVKNAGMTPMAFNDGIYYNNVTNVGTFDTDIIICYWSNGWSGYTPLSASSLVSKGFKLVNTNGSYYWVLGKTNAQCSADKASGFNYQTFPNQYGDETIPSPVGSMFCIWADYPGAETESSVISKTAATIAAFGKALPNLGISIIDGTTNAAPSPTTTVGKSMTLIASEKVTWTTSDDTVLKIESADADDVSTYAAYSVIAKSVIVTPLAVGSATITAENSTGKTASHSVTVNAQETKTITVAENRTFSITVDGSYEGPFTTENGTVATVATEVKEGVSATPAKVTSEDELVSGGQYLIESARAKANNSNNTILTSTPSGTQLAVSDTIDTNAGMLWTITESGSGYTVANGNNYLTVGNETSGVSRSPVVLSLGMETCTDSNGGNQKNNSYWQISSGNYYLNLWGSATATTAGGWTMGAAGDCGSCWNLYRVGSGEPQTTITFTGVKEGTTTVEIGGVLYTINVISQSLADVDPLTIEYWITNGRVLYPDKDGTNERSIAATTAGVATADGVYITADGLIPAHGYREGRTVDYWHSRLLDTTLENNSKSGTEKQTEYNGDDETASGVAFTKVRYYEGSWEVFTQNNQWVKVESKHQLIAYYAEHIKVTDEVDSHAADWGKRGDGTQSGDYLNPSEVNTLSVQVVYEDGITNPASTSAADLKSKTICYGYWTAGRGIGTLIFDETAEYQIYKVTAETGAMSGGGETFGNYTVSSFTWDDNEMTVWDEEINGSSNGQVVLHNNANCPETKGIYSNLHWDENEEAILIRVYVRAPLTEDTLNVHYIDTTNGSENEFYQYSINVFEETLFDPNFKRTNAGTLVGNTAVNTNNITQTVQWDLSLMPRISAAYRHAAYNFYNATRSTDGKDVYLYYTFSRTASFIADFGLPITISLAQINDTLGSANVTGIKVETQKYGDVTTDVSAKTITYTPTKTFGKDIESLQVTVSGEITVTDENGTSTNKDNITYTVYILPASNVLYEENFLTKADGWTLDTTTSLAASTAQETQKAGDTTGTTYNVFGYDNAYKTKTNASGVWKADGLTTTTKTGALTTSFYGNAFDLIGNCASDSGRVILYVSGNGTSRLIDIDTRYNGGTISQVPLAHIKLGEADATYDIAVYASGLKATGLNATGLNATGSYSTQSVMRASSTDPVLQSLLNTYGLTMADVEYVSMSASTASAVSSIATYATAATVDHQKGTHVEIDGFRVYRSTTDSVAENYPDNEKNVTYKNILDVVKDTITAYTENEGNKTVSVEDYEAAGGPQNEIYLGEGQSVTFSVGTKQTAIQVSLRAVSDPAQWATSADGNAVTITSNTEMYYAVTSNANGSVTIANRGNTLLAIGNVKLPAGVSTKSASEMDKTAVYESVCAAFATSLPVDPEPDQTVFVPEHFSIRNYATPLFRHKLVTLRIDFSKDVSYVEIDGRKYTPNKLASWFGYYTVTFTDTIGRNDDYFYKVVFFDANGNPSETQIVYGK